MDCTFPETKAQRFLFAKLGCTCRTVVKRTKLPNIKESFRINNYFSFLSNRKCRIFTSFRTRNHRLPIEMGRWTGKPLAERVRERCNSEIGDEYHYVLQCSYFTDERIKYIKPYYRFHSNTHKFSQLLLNFFDPAG